jgi:hypothetical protein
MDGGAIETNKNKEQKPLTLPDFSMGLKQKLLAGDIMSCTSELMEQMVAFYMIKYPDRMNTNEDYRDVGKKLYLSFPLIGSDGPKPWVSIFRL